MIGGFSRFRSTSPRSTARSRILAGGIQSIVDPTSRSFASAVTLFCINGVGIAFGAFIVGALSDILAPRLGGGSLRWALVGVSLAKAWSALHSWLASRHLQRAPST